MNESPTVSRISDIGWPRTGRSRPRSTMKPSTPTAAAPATSASQKEPVARIVLSPT